MILTDTTLLALLAQPPVPRPLSSGTGTRILLYPRSNMPPSALAGWLKFYGLKSSPGTISQTSTLSIPTTRETSSELPANLSSGELMRVKKWNERAAMCYRAPPLIPSP